MIDLKMRSETVGKIAEALAKAQAMFTNPEKNKTANIPMKSGGSYSYSYADLAAVIDATRKGLSENSICFVSQLVELEVGGKFREYIYGSLIHSSNEFLSSLYPLPLNNDPKVRASEITYGRRYILSAMTGVAADEDTDEAPEGTYNSKAPKAPRAPATAPKVGPSPIKPVGATPTKPALSPEQQTRGALILEIFKLNNLLGVNKEQTESWLIEWSKKELKDITNEELSDFLENIVKADARQAGIL